jgi:hypothetical protein
VSIEASSLVHETFMRYSSPRRARERPAIAVETLYPCFCHLPTKPGIEHFGDKESSRRLAVSVETASQEAYNLKPARPGKGPDGFARSGCGK